MSLVLVAAIVFLAGTGLKVVGMAADTRFESGLEEAGVHVVGSESVQVDIFDEMVLLSGIC